MKVGDLVAYIRLDDSQFQSGMNQAKSKFESLATAAGSAGRLVASTFTVGATAMGGLVANLAKVGFGYNSLQQNSRAALSTMLGGLEASNAQMDKLDEFARSSPFAKQVFIQAQQQMLGFGVEVEKVLPALDAVQNAVAATGGSSDAISNITYALSQMQAQGKFSGETLRDLGVYGIDAATIIGEKMGLTGAEIRKMASKPGGIPVDQVWDPLIEGLTAKFGGATDLIKQQMSGAVDRIKGAWRDIGSTISKPFVDPNGGGRAVEWANLVADILRSIEKQVKAVSPIIEGELGGAFGFVTDTLRTTNSLVAKFDIRAFLRQVDELSRYAPLVSGLGTAFAILGLKGLPVFNSLIGPMAPVIAGIAALVALSPELTSVGAAFHAGLAPAAPILIEITRLLADIALEIFQEAAPGLEALAGGAGELITSLLRLAPPLLEVVEAGLPLVGLAADLLGALGSLPTPILEIVTAFIAFKAIGAGNIFGHAKRWFEPLIGSLAASRDMSSQFGMQLGTMQTALLSGRAAIVTFGAAMKSAFIANAPLLAITALVTVIGAVANASAEAKAKVGEFQGTLDEATGAVTANTTALVNNKMEQAGIHDHLDTLGIDYSTFREAVEGSTEAQSRMSDEMARGKEAFDAYNRAKLSGQVSTLTPDTIALAEAYRHANGFLETNASLLSSAQEAKAREAATTRDATAAAEANAEILSRQEQALRGVIDAQREQAAAAGSLVDANYRVQDALDAANAALEAGNQITLDSAGNWDTTDASTRNAIEALRDMATAQNDAATAMQKSGASQEDLDAKLESNREKIAALAEAFGVAPEQIDAFLEHMGLVSELDAVSAKVDLDTEEGQKKYDDLLANISNGDAVMVVDADTDPALIAQMKAVGIISERDGEMIIRADTDPALLALLGVEGEVDESEEFMMINALTEEAQKRLAEEEQRIKNTMAPMRIGGNATEGQQKLDAFKRVVEGDRADLILGARDEASGVAQNFIRTYDGRHITMTVGAIATKTAMQAIGEANGGILKFFGNGGFENHVAQIAPAGAWRFWAEEETGGEGYIPLAMSKRSRSTQILGEIASMFGYHLIPRSTLGFAGGGTTVPTTSSGASPTGMVEVLVSLPDVLEFYDRDGAFIGKFDRMMDKRLRALGKVVVAR